MKCFFSMDNTNRGVKISNLILYIIIGTKTVQKKGNRLINSYPMSGWEDSNFRPPAPQTGTLNLAELHPEQIQFQQITLNVRANVKKSNQNHQLKNDSLYFSCVLHKNMPKSCFLKCKVGRFGNEVGKLLSEAGKLWCEVVKLRCEVVKLRCEVMRFRCEHGTFLSELMNFG